jgi:hypothetical protein
MGPWGRETAVISTVDRTINIVAWLNKQYDLLVAVLFQYYLER